MYFLTCDNGDEANIQRCNRGAESSSFTAIGGMQSRVYISFAMTLGIQDQSVGHSQSALWTARDHRSSRNESSQRDLYRQCVLMSLVMYEATALEAADKICVEVILAHISARV